MSGCEKVCGIRIQGPNGSASAGKKAVEGSRSPRRFHAKKEVNLPGEGADISNASLPCHAAAPEDGRTPVPLHIPHSAL